MNIRYRSAAGLVALTLLLGSGAGAAENSGFIDPYPELGPDPDRDSAMIWHKPGVDLGKYDKVIIDPIILYYASDSEEKGISPDKLKTFTDGFQRAIVDALEPAFPVVSKPGPGVLRVRLAVSDIKVKRAKLSIVHVVMPGGFGLRAMQEATGKTIVVENAVMEAELLDAATGERLSVLVDREPEQASGEKKKKATWDGLEATFAFYAKRFRGRLEQAH